MESNHHPSENNSTPSSASISPKKNFPASKTNKKSKYVINEQGKLVKLKSLLTLQKNGEIVIKKPTDSNDYKKNEQRPEQQQQFNKFHKENFCENDFTKKPSKCLIPEETLKFSTTKISSASKTNNQSSKCFINEQGKLVKLKSSVANPPVTFTGNRGRPQNLRTNHVDSHENKKPQEFEKSTTIEDPYFIYEKLNVSTKPIDLNDSYNDAHIEKNRKRLSDSRVELKDELSRNGYILCTKSTCQMGFLSIKGN